MTPGWVLRFDGGPADGAVHVRAGAREPYDYPAQVVTMSGGRYVLVGVRGDCADYLYQPQHERVLGGHW